ncbi:hypothetical protein BWQ96_09672 [Gracilariopsis chorda]|uniref:BZIP domain-containing protein n=1 Tax=Gracilariopsis chorda TaxID=448386 RepID=A0A2V3IEU6_9FLOR|nr:hypothetical protein BWQ96_09672 [Gracilariopsis chorda]|eukprot:PXF40609.1 hypothetical protein BWQ96_09672 [Gracilariopsis chorda]
MSAAASIRHANVQAERVRDQFKADKESEILQARSEAGDSNAEKYERRLRLNRHSAAASRIRRDAYTKALEAELIKMERSFRAFVQQMNSPRCASRAADHAPRVIPPLLDVAEPPDDVVDDIVDYIMPSLSHRQPL